MFGKVLVANRGEIAVRVLRACRGLGVATVAVWSDADRGALHVRTADEAVHLGPAAPARSYLDQEAVVQAALDTGAEAIHPGYGFLSENAAFARRVEKAGLVFIGPSPKAMDAMGDKVRARRAAQEAGVPVAPGSEALRDPEHAAKEAERIGYPVMLKAAGGGGGMGMRVVRDAEALPEAFATARAQAEGAFGSPDLFLERFLERPRHVEVQVVGDHDGRVVHLYERECSVQRRHQKLVEEAPCVALDGEQREELCAGAVALAEHVGYTNAGTLEFLYEDGRFHFNEMNARLQVEHPVTEMVTGVDLVQAQLRVAAGEDLGIAQKDVRISGHAVECRINAEDPARGFLPSPGPVRRLAPPTGDGVRVDHGLLEEWTVPGDYDSLVAKVVTHGADRDDALRRMSGALDRFVLEGFATNLGFHRALVAHPAFAAGDLSTRFLEEHGLLEPAAAAAWERRRAAAVVAALAAAPGAGLAGVHLTQSMPETLQRVPGHRRWGQDA